MRAHIEYRPGTMLHDIWLIQDTMDGRRQLKLVGPDEWEWVNLDSAGKRTDPSLSLDHHTLEALIAAGSDVLPPDRAQANHLQDAIKVRDRLIEAFLPKEKT